MTIKRKYFQDILLYGIIAVYFIILIVLLFFKTSSFRSVNLMPFRFIVDYVINDGTLAFSNVIGNIFMFVPMGIYLALINNKKTLLGNVTIILLFSIAAEILQYVLKIGTTDIDDVILNGIGGFLGIICYRVLFMVFKEKVYRVIKILSLIVGGVFILLFTCLHFGVFGFKIRII